MLHLFQQRDAARIGEQLLLEFESQKNFGLHKRILSAAKIVLSPIWRQSAKGHVWPITISPRWLK
ncbi:MAG: hypothetical protein Lm2023SU_27070 [Serratia ureilytica]